MSDRRYNEEEVAAIFRSATEGSQSPDVGSPHTEGLSLKDLQAIGNEIGIAPGAVAQAALALEVRRPAAARTLLGLPIAVERSVALNHSLSDAEWDLLVVELREVFNARGTVRSHGSLREWRNGNLQALLEPTPTGQRLRLKTVKGDARASIVAGLALLGVSAAATIATAAAGVSLSNLGGMMALFAAAGVALLANGALTLPRWARLRGRQMEAVAARLAATHLEPPARSSDA